MPQAADPVRRIADAVLYEGYILWPYRRSALKNRQRWTFGGVFPRGHSEGRDDDPWTMRTQCLLEAGPDTALDVSVRFLQVVRRQVARRTGAGDLAPVDELIVDGERRVSWEEATEREIAAPALPAVTLAAPLTLGIDVPAGREEEPLGEEGALVRTWHALQGSLAVTAEPLDDATDVSRVTVTIANTTPFADGTREDAVERTFNSCHTSLTVRDGAFVSATDPPPALRGATDALDNVGTWPVLVGDEGDRSRLLSSPIILEDYPRIAPESPGDLFDGGEIDGLLTLSILSLTDEEKDEMRATDPRAREILERTESLTPEELMRLHGTVRELGADGVRGVESPEGVTPWTASRD